MQHFLNTQVRTYRRYSPYVDRWLGAGMVRLFLGILAIFVYIPDVFSQKAEFTRYATESA